MRIISGTYKGKQLFPPSNFKARPTTDFAKEALFNIIENNFDIEEVCVLDLFAGTGSISFEFASRGAKRITTVELNSDHFKFIRKTVSELDFHQISTIRSDAFKIIKNPWESYDLIFADPPYDMKGIETIPELIFERKLLADDGWLILEHPSRMQFNHLRELVDHRKYGNVNFSFFKNP
ncbi:16S rRNA (guanine(966)-N(2))-methyltransferase RsmD [Bacteroidota bacterium]